MTEQISDDQSLDAQAGVVMSDVPCLACGYNLRGLDPRGHCPECGHFNLRTIESNWSMTKRELAALAYRVVALWGAVGMVSTYAPTFTGRFNAGAFAFVVSMIFFGMVMGLYAVVWGVAPWLGQKTFAEDGPVAVGWGPGAEVLMWVATAAIGMTYIIYGLVGLSASIVTFFMSDQMIRNMVPVSVAQFTIQLLIGVLLFIGSGQVSRFVMWLRDAGIRKDT